MNEGNMDDQINSFAEELTDKTRKFFYNTQLELLRKSPDLRKISFGRLEDIMIFPLTDILANSIIGLMMEIIPEKRSEFSMNIMNRHNQLLEKMVIDAFVRLKKESDDDARISSIREKIGA